MCPEEHYEYLLGFLNSSWSQLYINSESTYVQNRYWNYSQTVIESLPIVPPEDALDSEEYKTIEDSVELLTQYRQIQERIDDFPESYLRDSVEIDWIDYTWQTNRTSVEPSINEDDGLITVDVGRTDSIKDSLMNNNTRARYVQKAVEGMNVDSEERISIPVPLQDSVVKSMLAELRQDEGDYDVEHIRDLENEIDDTVFSLLGLDEKESQTVKDCLDLF